MRPELEQVPEQVPKPKSEQAAEIRIGGEDRLSLEERLNFETLLYQVITGEEGIRDEGRFSDWVSDYGKIIGNIIDASENSSLREMIRRKQYNEAIVFVLSQMKKLEAEAA